MSLFVCHRRPDRSFFWRGRQFPVCARCTGLYTGYFTGLLMLIWAWPYTFFWPIFLMVPLAVDGLTQYWQWRTSTNSLRFFTGILAGTGVVLALASLGYSISCIVLAMNDAMY
ncbi:MAG: DUF2085 domain-containing protein [Siphonobacter sp.]